MVEQATHSEKSVEAQWEAARGFLAKNSVDGAGRLLELRDRDEDRWLLQLGKRNLVLTEIGPYLESMRIIFQLRRAVSGVDVICGWVNPTNPSKFGRRIYLITNIDGIEEWGSSIKIVGTDKSDEIPSRVSIGIDDHSYLTSADLIEEAEELVV